MAFGIDDIFAAVTILSTIKSMVHGGPEGMEEQLGIPPPSGAGGFGVPQIDLSEMGQLPRSAPTYSGGGSTFGQAMASFQPTKLGDVLRPQLTMGSEDRRRRRVQ